MPYFVRLPKQEQAGTNQKQLQKKNKTKPHSLWVTNGIDRQSMVLSTKIHEEYKNTIKHKIHKAQIFQERYIPVLREFS